MGKRRFIGDKLRLSMVSPTLFLSSPLKPPVFVFPMESFSVVWFVAIINY